MSMMIPLMIHLQKERDREIRDYRTHPYSFVDRMHTRIEYQRERGRRRTFLHMRDCNERSMGIRSSLVLTVAVSYSEVPSFSLYRHV